MINRTEAKNVTKLQSDDDRENKSLTASEDHDVCCVNN